MQKNNEKYVQNQTKIHIQCKKICEITHKKEKKCNKQKNAINKRSKIKSKKKKSKRKASQILIYKIQGGFSIKEFYEKNHFKSISLSHLQPFNRI